MCVCECVCVCVSECVVVCVVCVCVCVWLYKVILHGPVHKLLASRSLWKLFHYCTFSAVTHCSLPRSLWTLFHCCTCPCSLPSVSYCVILIGLDQFLEVNRFYEC